MRRLLVACLGVAVLAAAGRRAEAAAVVRALRHITTPDSSRLIIECSGPVHYRLQRMAARPAFGVPARIYVDLLDSEIGTEARAPLELREGPLLRVRAGAPAAATARLILDVPGLTQFGAFAMPDPFRLIVDVRGPARAAAVASLAVRSESKPARPAGAAPQPQLAAAKVPAPGGAPLASGFAPRRFKIVVDPGHGGKDPGAIGVGGVAEKDVTLAIALRLWQRLAALPNVDVVLTRGSDIFLALEERTARANSEHADLFVSIHTNASPDPSRSGVETYYLNNTNDRATIRLAQMENGLTTMTGHAGHDDDTALILSDLIQSYKVQESVGLAEDIQRALIAALEGRGQRVSDLGVKQGPFYVLVGAGMPCVLAEVSFLTHPREGARLAEAPYQDAVADGLVRGIQRFIDQLRVAENL